MGLSKRITLVIASLGAGGAERVLSLLGNQWIKHGDTITLITVDGTRSDWYQLDPNITRVGLDLLCLSSQWFDALRNNAQRILRLRRAIKQSEPEFVVSFGDTTNVLTLLASIGLTHSTIVSERVDPREHRIGLVWNLLRSWSYPMARAIVIQSTALRDWAAKVSGRSSIYVIPNPIRPDIETRGLSASGQEVTKTVIAMGRLTIQKGFDLLLTAFARCLTHHPDWRLVILGQGEEHQQLQTQASQLGIENQVKFLGAVPRPEQFLSQAHLFVLSSRYEGFPNALLEAMACGLPVIAMDCPTGPKDIIRDGINGILVPIGDINALSQAIDQLMSNKSERERLGQRARQVREQYNIEPIIGLWDELFADVRKGVAV